MLWPACSSPAPPFFCCRRFVSQSKNKQGALDRLWIASMNVSVCLCRPWDVSCWPFQDILWSALGRDFNTTLLGAARELLQRAETRRHRADRQKRWLKAKKQVSASSFCIAPCVASGWRRKCLLPLKLSRIMSPYDTYLCGCAHMLSYKILLLSSAASGITAEKKMCFRLFSISLPLFLSLWFPFSVCPSLFHLSHPLPPSLPLSGDVSDTRFA